MLSNAQHMTLKDAVVFLRRSGVSVHYETLRRWKRVGVRGVKLHTRPIGGRRFVTEADLQAFFDKLGDEPDSSVAEPTAPVMSADEAHQIILQRYGSTRTK